MSGRASFEIVQKALAANSNFPVSDFLFARSQMGMSLAFHIVFATIGISLPVLMVISEALYLRTGRPFFLELANDGRAEQPFFKHGSRLKRL